MNAKSEVLRLADALRQAALIDDWHTFDADLASLRALAASMPDEGWKLVPVEPTQAMMEAGYKEYGSFQYWPRVKEIQGWGDRANLIYKAMLTAAPDPKEPTT